MCTFGFEAWPAYMPRLHQLARCYKSRGWRTQFLHHAVSNVDGEVLTFRGGGDNSSTDSASSLQGSHALLAALNNNHTVDVRTVDLQRWLEKHIFHRRLPDGFGDGAGQIAPVVLAKMDIEGSEYRVLPRLVLHSSLCAGKIDYVNIEEHFWLGFKVPPSYQFRGQGMSVKLAQELLKLDPNCRPTQILAMDDETYPKASLGETCPRAEEERSGAPYMCTTEWWCPSVRERRPDGLCANLGKVHTWVGPGADPRHKRRPCRDPIM